jgi:diguanylate cyclase (GGDEF)-like protein
MLKPPRSSDEASRLETLYSLALLDAPPQERFDRITRTARRLFGVPISIVSLIDSDRRWTMSHAGPDLDQPERDLSFCGHAAMADGVMVVDDAASHLQFFDNPIVTGVPRIRFYAGAPIRARNGARLGAICIMDYDARHLGVEEREALSDLAAMVEDEIDIATTAVVDELTGLVNRRGLELLGNNALVRARRDGESVSLLFADVDDLKTINDSLGHSIGDAALRAVAEVLWSTVRGGDVAARIGGDEFAVLLPDTEARSAAAVVQRIQQHIDGRNALGEAPYDLRISIGHASSIAPEPTTTLEDLLTRADAVMYLEKARAKEERRGRPGPQ